MQGGSFTFSFFLSFFYFSFHLLSDFWQRAEARCSSSLPAAFSPLDDFQNSIVPAPCAHRLSAPGDEMSVNLKPTLSCVLSRKQFTSRAFFLRKRQAGSDFWLPPLQKTPEQKCQPVTGRAKNKEDLRFPKGAGDRNETPERKPAALWLLSHRKCDDSAHKIFLLFFFSLVADMAQKKKGS